MISVIVRFLHRSVACRVKVVLDPRSVGDRIGLRVVFASRAEDFAANERDKAVAHGPGRFTRRELTMFAGADFCGTCHETDCRRDLRAEQVAADATPKMAAHAPADVCRDVVREMSHEVMWEMRYEVVREEVVREPEVREVVVREPEVSEVVMHEPEVPEVMAGEPKVPEVVVRESEVPKVVMCESEVPEVVVREPEVSEVVMHEPEVPDVVMFYDFAMMKPPPHKWWITCVAAPLCNRARRIGTDKSAVSRFFDDMGPLRSGLGRTYEEQTTDHHGDRQQKHTQLHLQLLPRRNQSRSARAQHRSIDSVPCESENTTFPTKILSDFAHYQFWIALMFGPSKKSFCLVSDVIRFGSHGMRHGSKHNALSAFAHY
jgi:hypothetical protein